jgi:hypothetical protein
VFTPPPHPVSEPFLLKFRRKITDEGFRTKAHYCSCQADYVLTASDIAAGRKSVFTWKTEISSAKLKTRNFSVDRHGMHVFVCCLISHIATVFELKFCLYGANSERKHGYLLTPWSRVLLEKSIHINIDTYEYINIYCRAGQICPSHFTKYILGTSRKGCTQKRSQY